MEILDLKNITEIKNLVGGFNSILDTTEKRISQLKGSSMEKYPNRSKEKKNLVKSMRDMWNTVKRI